MEKAGGKPKRAKYINKTFRKMKRRRNVELEPAENITSRPKWGFPSSSPYSILMNCAGQSFPYISLLNVLLLKMFFFLLPMSCTRLRASRQYGFVCEKTIATYTFFVNFSKKALITVLASCTYTKNAFINPIQNSHPFWPMASGVSFAQTRLAQPVFSCYTRTEKKRKFYLYLRKFRWDRLQIHIWGSAS